MKNHLTRVEIIAVLKEPRYNGVIKALAEKFNVSEEMIRFVRAKNKWMLKPLEEGRI